MLGAIWVIMGSGFMALAFKRYFKIKKHTRELSPVVPVTVRDNVTEDSGYTSFDDWITQNKTGCYTHHKDSYTEVEQTLTGADIYDGSSYISLSNSSPFSGSVNISHMD